MNALKQLFVFVIIGAPVGATISSFVAPPIIRALHAPAGEQSALCNCNDLATNIMQAFWHVQLGGTAVGAVLGAVVWLLLRRSGRLGAQKNQEIENENT